MEHSEDGEELVDVVYKSTLQRLARVGKWLGDNSQEKAEIHSFCARVLFLDSTSKISWKRDNYLDFQLLRCSIAEVTLDDGRRWLLLQPYSSGIPAVDSKEAVMTRLIQAATLILGDDVLSENEALNLHRNIQGLRPLHNYYLELFGWVEVPGLQLMYAPALHDELPKFCRTLESLQAYRTQPAFPSWTRPRANTKWFAPASRVICDHIYEVQIEELLPWVELRIEALTAEQVELPLVIHTIGQLAQVFDPMELHEAATEVYALYCQSRGIVPQLGTSDLQMRAAHDYVPSLCRCCGKPAFGRARCICAASMKPQLDLSELQAHSSDVKSRKEAKRQALRAAEILQRQDEVKNFDMPSFHRWLQEPKKCCAFDGINSAAACVQCLEYFVQRQDLQDLKLQPPDWYALDEEECEMNARLSEPPLVQAAWISSSCTTPFKTHCETSLRP